MGRAKREAMHGVGNTTPKKTKKGSAIERSKEHAPPKPKNYHGKGAPKGM